MKTKRKATKAERAKLLKAVKSGRVVIGNKAVTERKTPYIEVFKYEGGKRKDGSTYEAAEGFVLSWGEPGMGFGQITFVNKNGGLEIETECMGREFVLAQVAKMVTNAEITE